MGNAEQRGISNRRAVKWRFRVDIAGFLLSIGFMAIAAWLLISDAPDMFKPNFF